MQIATIFTTPRIPMDGRIASLPFGSGFAGAGTVKRYWSFAGMTTPAIETPTRSSVE